ncbi:MAG: TraB family protein, partial [Spirochaetaceae bacterium]|nr:TraB family protein [Spirochaetaceae bacterium]
MEELSGFSKLKEILKAKSDGGKVVIQTHDFPDHDAVAAAFALAELLGHFEFTPSILYRGEIRSHSLTTMIHELAIPLAQVTDDMAPPELVNCPCVIVDGNPANANAREATRFLAGVVDHHGNSSPPDCPFIDVRPDYGSSSAMVAAYWKEAGLVPPSAVATAILMGIEMDTDFLSRQVSRDDLDAFYRLFFTGDWQSASRIVKTSLCKADLPVLTMAVNNSKIEGSLFFTHLTVDCSQELISILADFFLRLREITVTVIVEIKGKDHHVSVRSRDQGISAAKIVREALKDIGAGGGHDHMAGGALDVSLRISRGEIFQRFAKAFRNAQERKLKDNQVRLELGGREIILVGTAHVSRESIDEAGKTIRENKPDMVCVELDQGRYTAMTEKDNWESLNVVKVFREGRGFLLLANLVLSSFQRRLGMELGVKPGEEMCAAVDAARELGVPYTFCDREVQITLRRAWGRCGFWSKAKLLSSLVSSAFTTEKLSAEEIENLKKRNELDGMMHELAEYLPSVKETLIDERDRYLAAKIWSSGGRKSVAILGAGHLAGVRSQLERLAGSGGEENLEKLESIPAPSALSKFLGVLIPLLIVALIAAGFFRGGAISLSLLLHWVLLNGSLAALGTLLALGHPLSVLVSFIGAPIATINPFIGVGLFSGITEASIRKPRVEDAENLYTD